MQIKTLLNRLEKHKGFVYQSVQLIEENARLLLEVSVRPRKGSCPVCSVCGHEGPGYDALPPRRFEFVPLWGMVVFLVYAMRRVDCHTCGVKVEAVPWANGKHRQTKTYAWFLAAWAKRLSWSEVADAFHTSWHHVFTGVQMAVDWGRSHVNLDGVTAIGVDEMAWGRWHRYLTVVYQINEGQKRLIWIGRERTARTLPVVWQGAFLPIGVHLQRHVEALFKGHRQEGLRGASYPGPLPYHGSHEQGH